MQSLVQVPHLTTRILRPFNLNHLINPFYSPIDIDDPHQLLFSHRQWQMPEKQQNPILLFLVFLRVVLHHPEHLTLLAELFSVGLVTRIVKI
jgi:hypothetical protein